MGPVRFGAQCDVDVWRMNVDELSDEVLTFVMRFVGWEGVAGRMVLVCRRWHAVGSDNTLWSQFYRDRTWRAAYYAYVNPSRMLAVFKERHKHETSSGYWFHKEWYMDRSLMSTVHPRDLPDVTLEHDTQVEVIIQGMKGVGKSMLTYKYATNISFTCRYSYNGHDIPHRKIIKLGNHSVHLDILDTSYESDMDIIFPEHNFKYLKSAQVLILVYSATSLDSFTACHEFIRKILAVKEVEWMPVVLVENKVDLVKERQVPKGVGEMAAERVGCLFVRTSAITGEGVEEVFLAAVKLYLSRNKPAPLEITIEGKSVNSPKKKANCQVS